MLHVITHTGNSQLNFVYNYAREMAGYYILINQVDTDLTDI